MIQHNTANLSSATQLDAALEVIQKSANIARHALNARILAHIDDLALYRRVRAATVAMDAVTTLLARSDLMTRDNLARR